MSLADIRHEVVLSLALTKEAQHEARWAYDHGSYVEKVLAAGELSFLQRQKTRLERRLDEVDRRIAERRTLFSWYRQVWFNLTVQVESWIAHG
jgi:hypothetical protein